MNTRLLVTGDRNWTESLYLFDVLSNLRNDNPSAPVELVIEGGARGADQFAGIWAILGDVPLIVCPADWDRYHKAAGPIRNKLMLDLGKPNLVIGFHSNIQQSKGTAHMLHISKLRGIRTLLFSGPGRGFHIVCPGPAFNLYS